MQLRNIGKSKTYSLPYQSTRSRAPVQVVPRQKDVTK